MKGWNLPTLSTSALVAMPAGVKGYWLYLVDLLLSE